ncbi:hypothetical protein OF83DRAFT_1175980 [Amylostereum chailletii]|nr:hypothetical protein OF83DRAFT_1175980 [Amylostereum chailletii]
MLWQLKADFNFSDALYLEPKLHTLMLGAFQDLNLEEQANIAAGGYHHTYFHTSDLDLAALTKWPSNEELTDVSDRALQDVIDLLTIPPETPTSLLARYSDVLTSSLAVKDEVDTIQMTLVADNVDKTILSLPESTLVDELKLHQVMDLYCKNLPDYVNIPGYDNGPSSDAQALIVSASNTMAEKTLYRSGLVTSKSIKLVQLLDLFVDKKAFKVTPS